MVSWSMRAVNAYWPVSRTITATNLPLLPMSATDHQTLGRAAVQVAGLRKGQVPLRVWLLVGYLAVLHITVMVSFTRTNDLHRLCEGMAGGAVGGDRAHLQLPH
jgi:hypothetical protein